MSDTNAPTLQEFVTRRISHLHRRHAENEEIFDKANKQVRDRIDTDAFTNSELLRLRAQEGQNLRSDQALIGDLITSHMDRGKLLPEMDREESLPELDVEPEFREDAYRHLEKVLSQDDHD